MLKALVLSDLNGGNDGQPLTPQVLSHLAATTSLTRLVFNCRNVEKVKVVRSEEEVEGWCQHIAQLHQLRHLDFGGGDYALGDSAEDLANLTQLTYLDIRYCKVPHGVAVTFGGALKCLQELDLSGNAELSDECAPSLAKLIALTSLGLQNLSRFTEQGLQALSSLRKLRMLSADEDKRGAVMRLGQAILG